MQVAILLMKTKQNSVYGLFIVQRAAYIVEVINGS